MPSLTIPGPPSKGWLVLIGGGEFSFGETREIDQFAVSKMLPDNRRVAFIPTASQSPEYANHFGTYLSEIDSSLVTENVPIYRPRDAKRGKNLNRISTAGMVYIGGGVTNQLVGALRGTPAVEAIRAALSNGAVVVAIGAGAAALGVFAHDAERPGAQIPGLALVPETAIETVFDPRDDSMLRRLMSLPDVRIGLGIPPRTALAISPDRTGAILGEEQVAVMRKA
jgi:cyanophycinase-like exopeptidase